jgi:hypothetical protein
MAELKLYEQQLKLYEQQLKNACLRKQPQLYEQRAQSSADSLCM